MLGSLKRAYTNLKQTEHIYMVLLALVVGLLGGFGAVVFRQCIHFGQMMAWQSGDVNLAYLHRLPAWWKVLSPAAGGLVVGLIVYSFAREAKGHGVPEVMEAVVLAGGRVRPRIVAAKLVASGICIASGGSVGREGPIVQIGSALGSTIGQWLGIGERRLRTLVGCGAAAGIAGTFNAPIAGALFVLEIILGDFGVSQFSPIVVSSVASTVVSRHYLGNHPALQVPSYSLVHPAELFAYVVLGLFSGLVAVAFIWSLYRCEDLFEAIPIQGPLKASMGGAIVGLIALRYPEVLGVGYEAIGEALRGQMIWHLFFALMVAKILAVSLTIGSGGSGGIFAPSLFIGAMVGGAVGTIVHYAWPEATAGGGAYALVGMAAVVAACTHAPLTAILIVFEMTNDYKIILPLMITCIISTLLAKRLERASIYTLKLLRRGVNVQGGRAATVLRHFRIRDVLRTQFVCVPPNEKLLPIISHLVENPGASVFVTDDAQHLLGSITMEEVHPVMADISSVRALLIAGDIMRKCRGPALAPQDSIDEAVRRFGRYRFETPVVENGRLVGAVWPQDVVRRYEVELLKQEMLSDMSRAVASGLALRDIPGEGGMSMAEIRTPALFVGRSMEELDVHRRFELSVLLIKRTSGTSGEEVSIVPDADFLFREGDVMLVMGAERHLRRLEREAGKML